MEQYQWRKTRSSGRETREVLFYRGALFSSIFHAISDVFKFRPREKSAPKYRYGLVGDYVDKPKFEFSFLDLLLDKDSVKKRAKLLQQENL